MSVCNNCIDADNIPECVTNLTFGTITSLATAVYIYIQNNSTDKIERLAITTGGAGELTVNSIDNTWLTPNNSYSAWAVLQAATNISTKETITNGTNTGECINFGIYPIFGDDDLQETYTNITMVS